MKKPWFALLVLVCLAPLQMAFNGAKWKQAVQSITTDKLEKKLVVGKDCSNSETLGKVEKNLKSLRSKLAAWGVAVDDKGKGYCGYDMISGKNVQRLDGAKAEDSLLAELTKFFSKKK